MKVTHDFHIHTKLSLCSHSENATVDHYVNSARRQGLNKIGFANHFWGSEPGNPEYYAGVKDNPSHYYAVQNYQHVSQIKTEIEKVKDKDVKLFFGCEAEYDPFTQGVAVTEEQAEQFDYILVPTSHTHMMMPKSNYYPYQKHADFMVQAFENVLHCNVSRYITAMAHPFEAVCCPYDRYILMQLISDATYQRLFDQAANKGIAIEINVFGSSHSEVVEQDERKIHMLQLAKACGCKFIFGSDAHSIEGHAFYSDCEAVADILNLNEDDLIEIAR